MNNKTHEIYFLYFLILIIIILLAISNILLISQINVDECEEVGGKYSMSFVCSGVCTKEINGEYIEGRTRKYGGEIVFIKK